MQTSTNTSAILSGEQRSNRFTYRHGIAGAAQEVGVPATWIWAWLHSKRLRSQTWLRKVWVRLDDVQKFSAEPLALRDAFYATGEFLSSPETIQRVLELWPDEHHPYIRFQPSSRVLLLPAADPVYREEEQLEVAA